MLDNYEIKKGLFYGTQNYTESITESISMHHLADVNFFEFVILNVSIVILMIMICKFN